MRGKNDPPADRGRVRRKSSQGGKAIKRLFQYLAQRDRALNDEIVSAAVVPKSARPRLNLTTEALGAPTAPADRLTRSAHLRRGTAIKETLAAELISAAIRPQSVLAPGAAAPPTWQSLGPSVIPNGQTYGTNRVEVIGRVAAIAIDPSDAQHVLCGSAAGGIWESFNAGGAWSARGDRMPSLAIGSIAFDPRNPRIVYVGSGEGNFYANLGAGVYRSSDGGATWSVVASSPFIGVGFFDLVVDPGDSDVIYAATTDGFFASADAGASWTQRRAARCWSISLHPNGGPAAEILATFDDGLFVSTTGGETLTPVALPAMPKTGWTRVVVDRVTTSPDVAYVYGAAGKSPFLWRRSGTTWERVTSLPSPAINVTQAWYDWYVAACPDNPNQVFLGAIDTFRGDFADGKWTWANITTQGDNSIHPDQHCLAFSPRDSRTIFAGCDGGIFSSPNSGATWRALNSGLGITEISYIAGDPTTSSWLMAGTQDNGTLRFTGAPSWDHIADGDGGACGVNQLNPNEIYHSYYDVSLERSNDKGNNWVALNPPSMTSLFYPPVGVYGRTVCIGGVSLIITRNGAPPWTTISLGLQPNDVATAIRMFDADTIYIGTQFGQLSKASWTSGSWVTSPLASPFMGYISSVGLDPLDPQRLWVTSTQVGIGNASVSRSDDGGRTWISSAVGLPPIPKNSVVVDATDSNRVWVATDIGVHQSLDMGASWAPFSNGLPNVLAADLMFHRQDRKLICGTRSRGVWAVPIAAQAVVGENGPIA